MVIVKSHSVAVRRKPNLSSINERAIMSCVMNPPLTSPICVGRIIRPPYSQFCTWWKHSWLKHQTTAMLLYVPVLIISSDDLSSSNQALMTSKRFLRQQLGPVPTCMDMYAHVQIHTHLLQYSYPASQIACSTHRRVLPYY